MGKPQDQDVYDHTHESGVAMTFPLIFLAILAVVSGFVVFNGVGTALGFPGGLPEFIYAHGPHEYHIDWAFAGASLAAATVGIFAGAWFYWNGRLDRSTQMAQFQPGVYDMLQNKFYWDEMYQHLIDGACWDSAISRVGSTATSSTTPGSTAPADVTGTAGYLLKHLQTGKVPNYAMGIALGVIVLAVAGLAVRG
jgi:NADH-quinone oxidoreductase subunit L